LRYNFPRLAPIRIKQIFDTILKVSIPGTTKMILRVEQNDKKRLVWVHCTYVLGSGASLTRHFPLNDPAVQAAYLGVTQQKEVILEDKDYAN
jgi:ABC-type branched-subunit amino acid transport system ATPase component